MRISALFVVFLGLSAAFPAHAAGEDFATWLRHFRMEASRQGVSQKTLNAALPYETKPIERVIALDRKQPEGTITFAQYQKNVVTQDRIRKGRDLMAQHRALLQEIGAHYGVQPQYIVALWGIETNFGSNTGGFSVPQALATLAWEGRRAAFFRGELLNALKIIEAGHVTAEQMKGSWAGAMGQTQFMPSSFLKFAVDYNNDGRRDIWGTHADVFASAANYLSGSGWNAQTRWGRKVTLPAGFDHSLAGRDKWHPVSFWQERGLRAADGKPLSSEGTAQAAVIQPDGPEGPAFLIYGNYKVLLAWNKSLYFATSVGLLADSIASP